MRSAFNSVLTKMPIQTINLIVSETSVLETIRKPPLVEAQTALAKRKNTFSGMRVSAHCRSFMTNCLLRKNFTQTGQSAAEL